MFQHPAEKLSGDLPLVYTAFSKHLFYYRVFISKFVLNQGFVPLNPFMIFDYFLHDSVDRNLIRKANNSIVEQTDEIWVFGPISNGVLAEIRLAQKKKKVLRFYAIEKPHAIVPAKNLEMEPEVKQFSSEIISLINPIKN